jgi:hypothetical protein
VEITSIKKISFWILGGLAALFLYSCGGGSSSSGGGGSSADYNYLNLHNAQYLDGHTIRWLGTINVFTNNIPGAEAAFNRWGLSFNFINYEPGEGVTLAYTSSEAYCGVSYIYYYTSGRLFRVNILIARNQQNCAGGLDNTLAHEAGHAVGYLGHSSDGGLMDPTGGSGVITTAVRNMVSLLYSMAPGTDINPFISRKATLFGKYRNGGTEIIMRVEH